MALSLYHLRRIGQSATKAGVADIMDFTKPVSVIGRNRTVVDMYLNSSSVAEQMSKPISRLHARVIRQGRTHTIMDDSRCGVFVNDVKISQSMVLNEGDKVTFGCPVEYSALKAGSGLRQHNSEFQFVFERCNCVSSMINTTIVSSPASNYLALCDKPNNHVMTVPSAKAAVCCKPPMMVTPYNAATAMTPQLVVQRKPTVYVEVTPEYRLNVVLGADKATRPPRGRSASPEKKGKGGKGKTPYQGKSRCFGKFVCTDCGRSWKSGNSWANTGQICKHCNITVYPCEQRPLKTENEADKKGHRQDLCGKCRQLGHSCMQ